MKYLLACLLAAVVSFFWGFVSWMLLGWHDAGMKSFKSEPAVAAVIKENATHGHGIYMLPGLTKPVSYASPDEQKKSQDEQLRAMRDGPYMYAIVRPGKAQGSMGQNMAMSFARSLLACLILGALMRSTVLTYVGRAGFGAGAGLFAALATDAQTWIWFELPSRDLMVNLADHFIEWLLVGLVLGLFLGRAPTANEVR